MVEKNITKKKQYKCNLNTKEYKILKIYLYIVHNEY